MTRMTVSSRVQRRRTICKKKSRDRRVGLLKQLVNAIKEESPCKDCRKTYPHWVMQFDHLEGFKKFLEVSSMVKWGYSQDLVMAEIAKCELVCANCHANRT